MTDAETFAAICADFPFDTATLGAISTRLDSLLCKTENRTKAGRDGTLDDADCKRLQFLTWAMRDLMAAMRVIEEGGDPGDLIPF